MPYKDPKKKAEWQKRQPERNATYKAKWLAGPKGQAYLETKVAEAVARRISSAGGKRGKALARRKYEETTRKTVRLMAIQRLGGRCARCGVDDERVLEFDHIIPLLVSDHGLQLLCANCHRIKTREGGEWALRFGLIDDQCGLAFVQFDLFGDEDD